MKKSFIISGISEHFDRLTNTCAYSAVLTDEDDERTIRIELTKSSTESLVAYSKESDSLIPLCDENGRYLLSVNNGDTVYLDIAIAKDN